jgi:hypothetical protein
VSSEYIEQYYEVVQVHLAFSRPLQLPQSHIEDKQAPIGPMSPAIAFLIRRLEHKD